jgi:hypothetical protein
LGYLPLAAVTQNSDGIFTGVFDNPSTSLTAPTSGASVSSSAVVLSATASDTFNSVAGATFYIDGTKQGSEDTSSPYSIIWDSITTSNTTHTVFIVARSSAGGYATSTAISFTVANATRKGGSSVSSQVQFMLANGDTERARKLMEQWPNLYPHSTPSAVTASTSLFIRNLALKSFGADVKALQQLLNTSGFTIALTGSGSSGNETNRFGSLTKSALIKYQKAHGIAPATGYFGPATRAFITNKNGG